MASQPSQEAQQKLYNDFILRFGFPLRIHHDQRGEFENRLPSRRFANVSDEEIAELNISAVPRSTQYATKYGEVRQPL